MTYNRDIHRRHSIRLRGYDYSQTGAYFVTICSWNRECLFGDIVEGIMHLNECGRIVYDEWRRSSEIRRELELDEFIIMPNHLHGIVTITNVNPFTEGANGRSPLHNCPNGK